MAESEQKLRIIPLGGVDEFGKNITVVECGEDMVVVDCGSIFPKEDMLGVDLVIPDVTYLIKNRERIRGCCSPTDTRIISGRRRMCCIRYPCRCAGRS